MTKNRCVGLILVVPVFLAVSITVQPAGAESKPDLVLLNGKIFTSDAARPYVEALAIRGERISAVGDSTTIKALAGPQTKQIDLAQALGFQLTPVAQIQA
jgi:hypothetical protein